MEPSFVHLRLHSEYSLVDGMVRVKPLVERAASLGMPAVAITDVCNFYALVKFYKAAQQVGIKPVCGSDLLVENPLPDALPSGVTLLVQNGAGYKNLTTLISRAYLEGQVQGKPLVQRQWLAENAEGLLILLGRESDVGQALLSGRQEQASELLQFWAEHFPERLYLMLCRTGRDEEEDYLHSAVSLAEINNCPVVATNDVRFLDAEQFEAIRVELDEYCSGDVLLGVFQKGFDIAHHRVEVLALVQQHAIPVGQLLFPVLLPFGEHVFFQQVVGFDNNERRRRLEAHPPFDADDGVAHMGVAADGKGPGQFLEGLYGLGGMGEGFPVQAGEFALFKPEAHLCRFRLFQQ